MTVFCDFLSLSLNTCARSSEVIVITNELFPQTNLGQPMHGEETMTFNCDRYFCFIPLVTQKRGLRYRVNLLL